MYDSDNTCLTNVEMTERRRPETTCWQHRSLYVSVQQEDLTSLGRVVLTLANSSVHCLQNLTAAMVFVSRAYSADLKNLILSVSHLLSFCHSLALTVPRCWICWYV